MSFSAKSILSSIKNIFSTSADLSTISDESLHRSSVTKSPVPPSYRETNGGDGTHFGI